jgi:anion-transporting  ArsA/GET3 family ATPase
MAFYLQSSSVPCSDKTRLLHPYLPQPHCLRVEALPRSPTATLPTVGSSRLLEARVRMQQKYLDQFYELYEDFHITKLPLLEEEVRGPDALRAFAENLVKVRAPVSPCATVDA